MLSRFDGFDMETKRLLAVPEDVKIQDKGGILVEKGIGQSANELAVSLALGEPIPVDKPFRDYSLFVFDTPSQTYAVLVDSKRKVMVYDVLLTNSRGGWKQFSVRLKSALYRAEREKAKGSKFSFIFSDLGSIRII